MYDKYGTKNPVAKYLMNGFIDSLKRLVSTTSAKKIHEVGCGEGQLSIILAQQNKVCCASDVSRPLLNKAEENTKKSGVNIQFKHASIYDLTPEIDGAELIVCCQVLEHIDNPHKALRILAQLANPYIIVSAPREPLWSILNMTRGAYLKNFGNTPDHCQRWSKKEFLKFLNSRLDILQVLSPIPWTIALCRSKESHNILRFR